MRYNTLLDNLQNLINYKPSQKELGQVLGLAQTSISGRANRNSNFTDEEIQTLEKAYNVDLIKHRLNNISESLGLDKLDTNSVKIPYRPEVYLSAGYGVEIYTETAEFMTLDLRLFTTDRGNKINPDNCEIVRVSGNSMEPEYRHGDRVIIDRADTELIDGHIFAFRYCGQCYVKEINLLGNKIKCISLNKDYDPFYINQDEEFMVLGRILPRIRL